MTFAETEGTEGDLEANKQALGDTLRAALGGRPAELDKFQEAAFAVKEDYELKAAVIKADTKLSPVGKNEELADLRQRTEAKLAELQAQQQRDYTAKRERLTSKLLDRNALEGSDSAATLSWRDAAERVAALEAKGDAKSALSLMRSALRTRDTPLEKSLLRAAVENRWSDVVNTYTAARPNRRAEVEELWRIGDSAPTAFMDAFTDNVAFRLSPDRHAIGLPTTSISLASWASDA